MRLMVLSLVIACGGATSSIAEIPPVDDDTLVVDDLVIEDPLEAGAFVPTEGGPLVRLGVRDLAAGESMGLEGSPCEEIVAYVESGRLRDGSTERAAGTLLRTQDAIVLEALEDARVVVSVNRPESHAFGTPGCDEVPTDDATARGVPTLQNAGGKLRVQIYLDAQSGGRFGSFTILDGDPDLSVPEHVHEASAEVLLIVSGDGTMRLGDEHFAITPGQVIYVPKNTVHGYVAGSTPLRAYQVYAGPGPEQRFRETTAAWRQARRPVRLALAHAPGESP